MYVSMIERSALSSTLYTRQQIARATGIDDSTLNYWMRECVLRPAEGGSGKGQHRRFPYHQINLAVLLDQLRSFGVSLPAIKRLADRFNDAISHYEEAGIHHDNADALSSLIYLRKKIEKDGYIEESVPEAKVDRYSELFPWFQEKELYRTHAHLPYRFRSTFDESVDILRRAYLAYDRPEEGAERYPDDLVALAQRLDLEARDTADPYWTSITHIEERSPSEISDSYFTPLILYREPDGEWIVAAGDPWPALGSYVGIYLDRLTMQAWSKL